MRLDREVQKRRRNRQELIDLEATGERKFQDPAASCAARVACSFLGDK
jgi:hypothetical protein